MATKIDLTIYLLSMILLQKWGQIVAFLGTIQNRKRVKYIPENNKE